MILESPSSLEEINVPRVLEDEVDFQGMRLKRVKVGPSLQANGSDAEETVDEKIQRYYDVASVLGPDIDMARQIAGELVRTIPIYSSMYT